MRAVYRKTGLGATSAHRALTTTSIDPATTSGRASPSPAYLNDPLSLLWERYVREAQKTAITPRNL